MSWPTIAEFLHKHQEAIALLAMAAIVTMPKLLPHPFSKVDAFQWAYEWSRNALLTLLSLKGPLPHGPESQSSERVKTQPDGTVESVKESTMSGSAPGVRSEGNDPDHA